jgi:hypothetical protein
MRTMHVEDAQMQAIVCEEKLEVLHPEYGTKPRVYYKNLDRWTKVFIAGSIAGEIGGVNECVAGARVVLEKSGAPVGETVSDSYGDFRFKGLDEDSGSYRLFVQDARFEPKTLDVEVGRGAVLDNIQMEKRPGA